MNSQQNKLSIILFNAQVSNRGHLMAPSNSSECYVNPGADPIKTLVFQVFWLVEKLLTLAFQVFWLVENLGADNQ